MADVLGNTWNTVEMLDISSGGAALIASEDLHVGASRILRFQLPGHDKKIHLVARVVNCNPHPYLAGYRIGLEFVRIDADDAQLVRDYIASVEQT